MLSNYNRVSKNILSVTTAIATAIMCKASLEKLSVRKRRDNLGVMMTFQWFHTFHAWWRYFITWRYPLYDLVELEATCFGCSLSSVLNKCRDWNGIVRVADPQTPDWRCGCMQLIISDASVDRGRVKTASWQWMIDDEIVQLYSYCVWLTSSANVPRFWQDVTGMQQ